MPKAGLTPWFNRKAQLQSLLGCKGRDDDDEGVALDQLLHHDQGGLLRSQTTKLIEEIRFSDKDLSSFGPLAEAQFGQVELVNCRLDNRVYVRKRVSKKFALRSAEQFSPQTEKHILLLALKSGLESASLTENWIPRLLCAYQCSSYLNIVMEYASGGSLWDVLESSPDGRLDTADIAWWAPQCVAAISWLHSVCGYAHRDIKPHNFVFRPDARLLLIDFGCAAPLLPPQKDGTRLIERKYCLVPCGTCDYISPEILLAHEEALVALEIPDSDSDSDSVTPRKGSYQNKISKENILQEEVGYGRETDWWSLGAMLYELAYGIAPFFANDIRQTYTKIMGHESSLSFDHKVSLPPMLIKFIKSLLTHHKFRLGRHSTDEITGHSYFIGTDWSGLHSRPVPSKLHLPQFTYVTPLVPPPTADVDEDDSLQNSKPFAFSALFQSSTSTRPAASPGPIHYDNTFNTPLAGKRVTSQNVSSHRPLTSFIGFSWGPPKNAFDEETRLVPAQPVSASPALRKTAGSSFISDPAIHRYPYVTPVRPGRTTAGAAPPSTIRVTSTRRSTQARPVSDREAMHQLLDLVGMSARKRVLESGKKPRILRQDRFGIEPPPPLSANGSRETTSALGFGRPRASSYTRTSSFSRQTPRSLGSVRKELRFDDTTTQFINASVTNTFSNTNSLSSASVHASSTGTSSSSILTPVDPLPYSASEQSMSSGTDGPPSPSPSPRPGSAMSMLSTRRSTTPTVSSVYLSGTGIVRAGSEPPEASTSRIRNRSDSLSKLILGVPHRPASAGPELLPQIKRENNEESNEEVRRARFQEVPVTPAPSRPHPKAKVKATPYPQAKKRERDDGGFSPSVASPGRKITVKPKPKSTAPALQAVPRDRPGIYGPGTPGLPSTKITNRNNIPQVDQFGKDSRPARTSNKLAPHDKTPSLDDVGGDFSHRIIFNDDLPSDRELEMREGRCKAKLEDAQERYEKLLRDIANVRLRIDRFAVDMKNVQFEEGETDDSYIH